MVQIFGSSFLGDQDLRSQLAPPLDTSQMQTPRASTLSVEHQDSSGSRGTSGYHPSHSRTVPSNNTRVQQTRRPSQDQSSLQQATVDLSTPLCFNDYLKLHNQTAAPMPFGPVYGSVYTSTHGVLPNPLASEYTASAPHHPHHPHHPRAWSDGISGHRSSGAPLMAADENAADDWSYHLASFPSDTPPEHGSTGDYGESHGFGLQTPRNYRSTEQPGEPEFEFTTPGHKHQTWEQLARELGLHA